MGAPRRKAALPGSDCLSDSARGTFPGRWSIYTGLITSNLEISPRTLLSSISNSGAFIPLPFSPCSEFPLLSQSHFLLLWLFLAREIRDTSVISRTFEVPINNRAAWPTPEPSASSSDQRLASRRPQPWYKALYWIPKAGQAGPVLSHRGSLVRQKARRLSHAAYRAVCTPRIHKKEKTRKPAHC